MSNSIIKFVSLYLVCLMIGACLGFPRKNQDPNKDNVAAFNKELKEISKDTEQQKALNEVVHSIKKYSLEYRSRHVTDMKELQTLMEEKRKLQTLQISF